TSVRVSISSPEDLACSGLIYSGVPTNAPRRVNIVSAVSFWVSALATPKSMIFGAGRPSTSVTRTFDGFKSRFLMGVLDSVADAHEKFQALADAEVVLVAVSRDGNAGHVLHHEVRRPLRR